MSWSLILHARQLRIFIPGYYWWLIPWSFIIWPKLWLLGLGQKATITGKNMASWTEDWELLGGHPYKVNHDHLLSFLPSESLQKNPATCQHSSVKTARGDLLWSTCPLILAWCSQYNMIRISPFSQRLRGKDLMWGMHVAVCLCLIFVASCKQDINCL